MVIVAQFSSGKSRVAIAAAALLGIVAILVIVNLPKSGIPEGAQVAPTGAAGAVAQKDMLTVQRDIVAYMRSVESASFPEPSAGFSNVDTPTYSYPENSVSKEGLIGLIPAGYRVQICFLLDRGQFISTVFQGSEYSIFASPNYQYNSVDYPAPNPPPAETGCEYFESPGQPADTGPYLAP